MALCLLLNEVVLCVADSGLCGRRGDTYCQSPGGGGGGASRQTHRDSLPVASHLKTPADFKYFTMILLMIYYSMNIYMHIIYSMYILYIYYNLF